MRRIIRSLSALFLVLVFATVSLAESGPSSVEGNKGILVSNKASTKSKKQKNKKHKKKKVTDKKQKKKKQK